MRKGKKGSTRPVTTETTPIPRTTRTLALPARVPPAYLPEQEQPRHLHLQPLRQVQTGP
jgi:hypothetical protein